MPDHRDAFLRLAIERQVLRFGEFTLKSGRVSPYFFNAGRFQTGAALAGLGRAYAATIVAAGLDFDLLFGPAYKGIPLVSVTAAALWTEYGRDLPWAFNRKEAKDHGEGGRIVGAPLAGRVLIIDDVITAGTAIRESLALIEAHGAELAGVVIALDRQERGQGDLSAVQEIEQSYGVPVVSIATVTDLMDYLARTGRSEELAAMRAYQARYGIAASAEQ